MVRPWNAIRFGLAGVLSVAVLTACGDRMRSMKSRKYTIEQCHQWAKKNNKSTQICGGGQGELAKKNPDRERSDVNPEVTPTQQPPFLQPNDGSGTPANPGNTGTVTGGTGENAGSKPLPAEVVGGDTTGNPGTTQNPAGDSQASNNNNTTNDSNSNSNNNNSATDNDGIARAAWMEAFNVAMSAPDPVVSELVKGISVLSGVEQEQVKLSVEAVILTGADKKEATLHVSKQPVSFTETIKAFESTTVMINKGNGPVAAQDEVLGAATCINSDCKQIGLMFQFKQTVKDESGNDKVIYRIAAFLVNTGDKIVGSNLNHQVSYQEAQNNMATPQLPQVVTDGGNGGNQPATTEDGASQPAEQSQVVDEPANNTNASSPISDDGSKDELANVSDEQMIESIKLFIAEIEKDVVKSEEALKEAEAAKAVANQEAALQALQKAEAAAKSAQDTADMAVLYKEDVVRVASSQADKKAVIEQAEQLANQAAQLAESARKNAESAKQAADHAAIPLP